MLPAIAETKSIAEAFVDARKNAAALAAYPGTEPGDLQTALAIQDAAIPLFGEEILGWKVGRINSPWLEKIGVNRLPGPIFAKNIQRAKAGQQSVGRIFEGGFGAAEAEFVFRLRCGPEAGAKTLSLAQTADLVDAVFIGIEVASSPFVGINIRGPLVTISDFGNNNGLILGAEIPDWRDSELADWNVEAAIDGEAVGRGAASAFPDGPLGSVRYLIEHLLERGIVIEPGLLISTGAITGVHEITNGQAFEAKFGDFDTINCKIAFATV